MTTAIIWPQFDLFSVNWFHCSFWWEFLLANSQWLSQWIYIVEEKFFLKSFFEVYLTWCLFNILRLQPFFSIFPFPIQEKKDLWQQSALTIPVLYTGIRQSDSTMYPQWHKYVGTISWDFLRSKLVEIVPIQFIQRNVHPRESLL